MSDKLEILALNIISVSVVTVVYNAVNSIRATMESVLEQDYPHIEYIVIDGGSTDGTLDVVEDFRGRVAHISSGPDSGIYDAMNKGIAMATGQWVNFMNAGDRFSSKQVVSNVVSHIVDGDVVLYGEVEICYPQFNRRQVPGDLRRLWAGMQFSHQAAFMRLDYHKLHTYDLRYRIAADLHFFYNAYSSGVPFREVSIVIASVSTGGISETNRIRTILESADAVCGEHTRPWIKTYFYFKALDGLARNVLKKILPSSAVRWITLQK